MTDTAPTTRTSGIDTDPERDARCSTLLYDLATADTDAERLYRIRMMLISAQYDACMRQQEITKTAFERIFCGAPR